MALTKNIFTVSFNRFHTCQLLRLTFCLQVLLSMLVLVSANPEAEPSAEPSAEAEASPDGNPEVR